MFIVSVNTLQFMHTLLLTSYFANVVRIEQVRERRQTDKLFMD